ncbi:FadR/GntR family transcriptional regulator [Limnohabitans sp.]|uniref:FadR/GntR family transcriptional regulator n=1 Tax=Limnohabitans sp. TaxID=1907725 RepID=UPI00391A52BC
MPLHTIEPQRLYRQIAGQLRDLMVEGEFSVGSRLPAERELAQQLGVSRPSVREALIALEVEGIIEVRTGSGIYVKSRSAANNNPSTDQDTPDDWGPLEVISARIVVESEVAALAAQNAGKAHLKAIRAALRRMQDEAARGEVPRWGDEAFHESIAEACGTSVLLDTVRRFWQARNGPLFERLGAHFEHSTSWQAAISEHQQVLWAIEERNSAAARRAMQKHLRQAHKRYSASWRRAPAR